MKFGVDVSRWQGNYNWERAMSEGVQFAIIKAGGSDGGRYRDGQFENNYSKCKQLGIPVGAYYFGRDMSVADAQASANHFLTLLAGKKFELPIYYDVEGAMVKQLDKNTLTTIVDTFCSIIEKAGYYTGIYSSASCFKSNMNDNILKKYTHWVAGWMKNKPVLASGASVDIWQFGGETNLIRSNKVAGVTTDQDYMYVDFPTVIKKCGLNGYSANTVTTPAPVKKTNEELALEVLDGKWGNGVDRKQRLTAAGYNYSAVQTIVNKLVQEGKR